MWLVKNCDESEVENRSFLETVKCSIKAGNVAFTCKVKP